MVAVVKRVTEASGLKAVMASTPALSNVYCDMDDWIKDDRNWCFAAEDGLNYGAFEFCSPGVVIGHYFFNTARGKQAIHLSRDILEALFEQSDTLVVQGLTPLHHKAALWMNRQLGFTAYQTIDTEAGPHQIFVLTKAEWNNRK